MAIRYTSSIPRVVQDNGAPLDQAPNFRHVYEWDTWNRGGQPPQYYRPGDLNYYTQGADANQQGGGAPKKETQSGDRGDFKSRVQDIVNNRSDAWNQSVARGRAAQAADNGSIDGGSTNPSQVARRNAAAGSPEWVQSNLPSGSPNGPLDYSHTGDTLNGAGEQALRGRGWSDEQIANLRGGQMNGNWGAHQWMSNNGYVDHTQQQYEDYLNALRYANRDAEQGGSYNGGGYAPSAPAPANYNVPGYVTDSSLPNYGGDMPSYVTDSSLPNYAPSYATPDYVNDSSMPDYGAPPAYPDYVRRTYI